MGGGGEPDSMKTPEGADSRKIDGGGCRSGREEEGALKLEVRGSIMKARRTSRGGLWTTGKQRHELERANETDSLNKVTNIPMFMIVWEGEKPDEGRG